ncbi:MAG: phage tail protein [Actinobacteria bacterium]|nr:phage tail protein [Actinomycetota bacterium]
MPEAAPTVAPSTSGAQPGVFIDPFRAYNFKLSIGGVTEGHFVECSGLDIKINTIRYREGGTQQVVHAIPGRVEYGDIVLRYGLTRSRELWQWFMSGIQGKVERRNVSILLLEADGVLEATRWDLTNAWPARWRGAVLDAMTNEVAIESVTLVFETLQRA